MYTASKHVTIVTWYKLIQSGPGVDRFIGNFAGEGKVVSDPVRRYYFSSVIDG